MQKLFTAEVTIHATAYIKAENESDAAEKALDVLKEESLHLQAGYSESGISISALRFDSPDLPDVSLVTLQDQWNANENGEQSKYDDVDSMRSDLSDDRLLDEFAALEAMIMQAREIQSLK